MIDSFRVWNADFACDKFIILKSPVSDVNSIRLTTTIRFLNRAWVICKVFDVTGSVEDADRGFAGIKSTRNYRRWLNAYEARGVATWTVSSGVDPSPSGRLF